MVFEESRRQNQMTASREAQHTHFFGVNMIVFGMLAHPLQGPLCIGLHIRILIATEEKTVTPSESRNARRAIMQHESGDALVAKPHGHRIAFHFLVKPIVTTAWTNDDGLSVGILVSNKRNQCYFASAFHMDIFPYRDFFLCHRCSYVENN